MQGKLAARRTPQDMVLTMSQLLIRTLSQLEGAGRHLTYDSNLSPLLYPI